MARDSTLRLRGDDRAVAQAANIIERLARAAERGEVIDRHQLLEMVATVDAVPLAGVGSARGQLRLSSGMSVYLVGRTIKPATAGQRAYLDAIENHDLTFCSGPAGTGKTYLAVAAATVMLKRSLARKLVLVRPAVEAGEKLGFLPGTMQEKVNPYLRPLLDALHDMMPFDQIERFMAADLLEIIPLAFMRGRTLNDAVVILDEAQNTTRGQMLMFLTRLGQGSKMIVTGDTSQIDLPDPRDSGLVDAVRRLRRVPNVAMVSLSGQDIVRHSLVQRIVEAYAPATGKRKPKGRSEEGGQDSSTP
ncbi:MAG: PhoH family protein [Phycisphaeraceae bacterium]|nr:PhoH family protein [Phycisphaeraceae bacterium]